MAHTIFLLHGMGDADKNWADPLMAALKAKYAEYQFSKSVPFDQSFEFFPLFYNDQFEKYLKAWNDNAANLGKWGRVVAPLDNGFVAKLTQIAGRDAGDSFAVKYIGDVLLYMLTDIREAVKTQVLVQFTGKLKPRAADGWSIVSHSLGTRVMTDTLQALFTDPGLDAYTVYGKAKVVMSVANVSLLLQTLARDVGLADPGDVYHNTVFPSTTPGRGACGRFINPAHDLDPFLFLARFQPPNDFGNAVGAFDRSLYQEVRLPATDLTGPNPHDFAHYLHHPDVHQALFQGLVDPGGPSIFSNEERASQLDQYHQESRNAALTAVRDELGKLKPAGKPTLDALIDILTRWDPTEPGVPEKGDFPGPRIR